MTLPLFGYLILISIDFYNVFLCLHLTLVSTGKIYQTLKLVFDHISKHHVRQVLCYASELSSLTLFGNEVKHCLNSSTIDKLGEWCLERRVRPRIKPNQMHRVSMTTLWAAVTHPALSHRQVSGNTNTYQSKREGRARNKITVWTIPEQ